MELLAFLLLVFEATFCCAKVSAAQPVITRMEKLRFWHRAAIYCGYELHYSDYQKSSMNPDFW